MTDISVAITSIRTTEKEAFDQAESTHNHKQSYQEVLLKNNLDSFSDAKLTCSYHQKTGALRKGLESSGNQNTLLSSRDNNLKESTLSINSMQASDIVPEINKHLGHLRYGLLGPSILQKRFTKSVVGDKPTSTQNFSTIKQ